MKDFNAVVNTQLERCQSTLVKKGIEYADVFDEDDLLVQPSGQLALDIDALTDRLRAFKKAAVLMNTTPKAALFGMLSKHLVSVSDMCTDGQTYNIGLWNEKITDSMCYLILLRAIVEEELLNEKNKNESA
jgi:hypothetical protein